MKSGLPNKQFRRLIEFINETRKNNLPKIYEDKKPREIDWVAYSQSQINDSRETLLFIKKAVDKCIIHQVKSESSDKSKIFG